MVSQVVLNSLLVLLLAGCSTAQLTTSSTLLLAADYAQTKELIKMYDEGHYETNIYLGKYPTESEVDKYFAGVFVGHGLALYYLPPKPKKVYLYFMTILEGIVVYKNHKLGITIKF